jgi:hypothetical protein
MATALPEVVPSLLRIQAARPPGVNAADQIVGTYTVGTGSTAQMHGFLLSNPTHHAQWQTIDAPNGVGTTTINGLNDHGDLVGFYVDGNGNTDGFLAHQS